MKIKKWLKKYWITIVGIAIGAIGGYFYPQTEAYNLGDSSFWSITLGAIIMGLLFSMFSKKR